MSYLAEEPYVELLLLRIVSEGIVNCFPATNCSNVGNCHDWKGSGSFDNFVVEYVIVVLLTRVRS